MNGFFCTKNIYFCTLKQNNKKKGCCALQKDTALGKVSSSFLMTAIFTTPTTTIKVELVSLPARAYTDSHHSTRLYYIHELFSRTIKNQDIATNLTSTDCSSEMIPGHKQHSVDKLLLGCLQQQQ
jgi:hypothetical protein